MKKFYLLFLITLFALPTQLNAKVLNAFISYSSFYSPQDGPYLVTYISVLGKSVNFVPLDNGNYQGKLEILILFKQNDSIKAYRKYNLLSPEITDTSKNDIIFHDQQRISLPNGDYNMEIKIRDVNSDKPAYIVNEPISILFDENEVQVSGIELVESYSESGELGIISKSGFDLIPLPLNYYPPSVDRLIFYTEIYNTSQVFGADGKYLLRIYVEELQTSRKINSLILQKRMDSREVEPVLHEFDISDLSSGDYNLVIEIKDRENKLLAMNKLYFARKNDSELLPEMASAALVENSFVQYFTNKDTLADYIRSLRPISTSTEKNFVDKNLETADLLTMKKFFLNFWLERDPLQPEKGWAEYSAEVVKVNYNYGSKIRKGYDTDRGRVYLQYGPPNSISEALHEPNAYPYEIWHYYTLMNQSNRKFVFYNPDLVTNDFELLHSDVTGEYSDYNWKVKLMDRNYQTNDLDEQDPDFGWGSNVNDFFTAPR
jgi:GWxTD domain-containing protein